MFRKRRQPRNAQCGVEEEERKRAAVRYEVEKRVFQRCLEQGVLGDIVKRWEEHGLESRSCHLLTL